MSSLYAMDIQLPMAGEVTDPRVKPNDAIFQK